MYWSVLTKLPSLQSPVGHRICGHSWTIESVYFEDQISAELMEQMEIYFVNDKCNGCSKSYTGKP